MRFVVGCLCVKRQVENSSEVIAIQVIKVARESSLYSLSPVVTSDLVAESRLEHRRVTTVSHRSKVLSYWDLLKQPSLPQTPRNLSSQASRSFEPLGLSKD